MNILTIGSLVDPPTKTISDISFIDMFASLIASSKGFFNFPIKSLHKVLNLASVIFSKISLLS